MLAVIAAQVAMQGSRFIPASPLPGLPPFLIDGYNTGNGLASEIARTRAAQARIMWIDATANLDRVNSEEKIVALVRQIRAAGFNTISFDVKPISGQVMYPTPLRPKLTEWRGRTMDAAFDPVPIMVREAKANGLLIWASLNAFSEGHSMFKVGPGYGQKERQQVVYEPTNVVRDPAGLTLPIALRPTSMTAGTVALYPGGTALVATPELTVASLRRNGTVAEVATGTVPALPKGGGYLAALGAAGDLLRRAAVVGQRPGLGTQARLIPISEQPNPQIPLMMNSHDPVVREDEIRVIEELVQKYAFDGVMYDDRLRYAGLFGDFSEIGRRQFEENVGATLRWPEDVFEYSLTPSGGRGVRPGAYYDRWLAWRAGRLGDWIKEVRARITKARPGVGLGVYVGSWYGEYAALGNNWASEESQAGFWFLDPRYRKTGMAGLFDWVITGCYYPNATIHDAFSAGAPIGATVEAAGAMSSALVDGRSWTYAGIALSDFKDDPDGLRRALQAATASTQGVMCFDLSHDVEPLWPVFTEAFAAYRRSPNAVGGLLAELRRRRALAPTSTSTRPVITFQGGAGTGQ